MDQPSREQARLILDDSVSRAKKTVEERLVWIYTRNTVRGALHSGATIKSVVDDVEGIAAEFITECVDRVAPVAKDTEAFAMIHEAVESFLRFLVRKVDEAARTAAGQGPVDLIMQAARELHREGERNLRRQLEIHRFTFTVPQAALNSPVAPVPTVDQALPSQTFEKNRGGKPLAAHWDAMWAAIAVMLYAGDLQPKTQADVERAMHDWLTTHELEVGETAVRGRARKLWQALQRAN